MTGLCKTYTDTSFQHQYVNQFKTWSEAQEYCRSVHNDLVTVENMVAMGSLLKTVDPQYKGKVWIGLVRGTRKQLHWSLWENTQPITYTNWLAGEPNGGTGVCGAKCLNGQWCDLYCSDLALFICFDENQGKNILVNTRMSWNQAQLYCRQHYTDLASIPNSTVEMEINNLIGGNLGQYIWTGLFVDSWEWSNSSKMSSFRNWKIAPTSYGNCAAVDVNNGSLWDNLSCELNLPFICEGGRSKLSIIKQCKVSAQDYYLQIDDGKVPAFFFQIKTRLIESGMSPDIRLQWRNLATGSVFKPKN
ncbi:hypothetical protein ACEWY4_010911 [Coilia grayii]|uniref:C-type lectin domain-containing protein n=1 Tax=Coilia grayii TaxID=363190 RepID=A0ABD1K376_9TELE